MARLKGALQLLGDCNFNSGDSERVKILDGNSGLRMPEAQGRESINGGESFNLPSSSLSQPRTTLQPIITPHP